MNVFFAVKSKLDRKIAVGKGKNIAKTVKGRELDRLIVESREFSKKYKEIGPFLERVREVLEESKIENIPVSVFKNKKLGILEGAVKYLKEENDLPIGKIAKLFKREYTTIHSTYQKAKKKFPGKFTRKEGFPVNVKIFSDRKLSPLHSIISFLKEEKNMRFTEIAKALKRDVRNVSYTYHKYKK